VGLAASAGPPRGHTCLVLDAFYQTRAQQEVTYVTGHCEVAARILPVVDWEAVGASVQTCEEAPRAEGLQAGSISRIPKNTFVFVC